MKQDETNRYSRGKASEEDRPKKIPRVLPVSREEYDVKKAIHWQ